MQLGLRADAPRAPVTPTPGVVDVIESACHLAALYSSRRNKADAFADALVILVQQAEASGLLARYRRQLGEMP